jgi:hypothetical protein
MFRTGSSYFYSNTEVKFGLDNIKKIKYLRSKRVESSYIEKVMIWENSTNEISLILNVYARLCKIPNDFIKRHKIKPYHISLIRRMYFDYDNQEKETYLNFKRPYGNSYVFDDIAEEFLSYKKIELVEDDDGEWVENNSTILENIHNRTMEIFDLMLIELMIDSTEYINLNHKHGDLNGWKPTKNGISEIMKINRKAKLKRLIKN